MTLRPQRLALSAPIGSLLKRTAPAAQPHRVEGYTDANYLALIRQCPCLYCGMDPCGEAAHVRFASAAFGKASGMQKKPEDKWAVPLCGEDHRIARHAQHNRGEEEFWASIDISPLVVAERLHAKRGDLVAMRAVAFVAISERKR